MWRRWRRPVACWTRETWGTCVCLWNRPGRTLSGLLSGSAPFEMSHDTAKDVLSAYGTVRKIEHEAQQSRPTMCTGTRCVCMIMRTPVPNFIVVQGFQVMWNYPGMRRLCHRCGHLLADCQTPRCGICLAYGHMEAACTVKCSICSGGHTPSRCPMRVATYASVAVGLPTFARPKKVRAILPRRLRRLCVGSPRGRLSRLLQHLGRMCHGPLKGSMSCLPRTWRLCLLWWWVAPRVLIGWCGGWELCGPHDPTTSVGVGEDPAPLFGMGQ
ncbi:uncharacterized protein LOC143226937 [Tachypleus tridentatus]|uniref:uncharacterized protein LOC143226937 n=1 Tax=Tachypleus tridentatus TaxID=6853 RepID=UPI003FD66C34